MYKTARVLVNTFYLLLSISKLYLWTEVSAQWYELPKMLETRLPTPALPKEKGKTKSKTFHENHKVCGIKKGGVNLHSL
jgi:hypothetical protein